MRGPTTVVLFVASVLALSCSDDETPPLTPPPTGVALTVMCSPVRVIAGHPYEIRLDIVNHGPAVELDTRCTDQFGYRIRSEQGSIVFERPGAGCVLDPNVVRLKAGEKRTVRWGLTASMEPARYEIEAGVVDHEDEYPWAETILVVTYP